MSENFESSLKTEIERYITKYATERANEYLQMYSEDLRVKLREAAAKACIEVFRVMEFDKLGNTLTIEIRDLTTKKGEI